MAQDLCFNVVGPDPCFNGLAVDRFPSCLLRAELLVACLVLHVAGFGTFADTGILIAIRPLVVGPNGGQPCAIVRLSRKASQYQEKKNKTKQQKTKQTKNKKTTIYRTEMFHGRLENDEDLCFRCWDRLWYGLHG